MFDVNTEQIYVFNCEYFYTEGNLFTYRAISLSVTMKRAIVYHEDFNKYDLGIDHPLIGDKPKNIMSFLKEKSVLSEFQIFTPKKAT